MQTNKTLFSATQIARRLAEFISVLNKEDVSRLQCQDQIVEVGAGVIDWVVKSFRLLFLDECPKFMSQIQFPFIIMS